MQNLLTSLKKFVVSKTALIVLYVAVALHVVIQGGILTFSFSAYVLVGLLQTLLIGAVVVFASLKNKKLLAHGLLAFVYLGSDYFLLNVINLSFGTPLTFILSLVTFVVMVYLIVATCLLWSEEGSLSFKVEKGFLMPIGLALLIVYLTQGYIGILSVLAVVLFVLALNEGWFAVLYLASLAIPKAVSLVVYIISDFSDYNSYITVALSLVSVVILILAAIPGFKSIPRVIENEEK